MQIMTIPVFKRKNGNLVRKSHSTMMRLHYDNNGKVEMSQMMIKIESRIMKNKAMEERRNVSPNGRNFIFKN